MAISTYTFDKSVRHAPVSIRCPACGSAVTLRAAVEIHVGRWKLVGRWKKTPGGTRIRRVLFYVPMIKRVAGCPTCSVKLMKVKTPMPNPKWGPDSERAFLPLAPREAADESVR